jgi:hypothetical protein
MGLTDRIWETFATVLRMNDKVERMTLALKSQQDKIENLTERVIRLETALELGLAARRRGGAPPTAPLLPRD